MVCSPTHIRSTASIFTRFPRHRFGFCGEALPNGYCPLVDTNVLRIQKPNPAVVGSQVVSEWSVEIVTKYRHTIFDEGTVRPQEITHRFLLDLANRFIRHFSGCQNTRTKCEYACWTIGSREKIQAGIFGDT